MPSIANINKLFPPKQFNDSEVSKLLLTKEQQILIVPRTDKNKDEYETFDNLFNLFLSKLPSNNVKKFGSTLFNKKLIFMGASSSAKNDAIFARVLTTPDGKLSGVILDSNVLDIDLMTGDTSSIDDCVYASYFGLVRASILYNKDDIAKNKDLHKLLTTYIWHIILRSVGQRTIYNEKQKKMIHIVCIYAYYRHFLNYKHPIAQRTIKKDYSPFFTKEEFDEFIPMLDNISKYDDIKFLPHMLVSLKIYHETPAALTLSLINKLGNSGFYSYISSLDQFISMVVICKYPTNLFPKTAVVADKIHDSIEKILSKYIEKIKYENTKLFAPGKK